MDATRVALAFVALLGASASGVAVAEPLGLRSPPTPPSAPSTPTPGRARAWVAVDVTVAAALPPAVPAQSVIDAARDALEQRIRARPDLELGSTAPGSAPPPALTPAYVIDVRIMAIDTTEADVRMQVEFRVDDGRVHSVISVMSASVARATSVRAPVASMLIADLAAEAARGGWSRIASLLFRS